MNRHALPSDLAAYAGHARTSPAEKATRFVLNYFLLLPIGALIGLVWANTAAESYFRISHALAFFVNDIAMALFFGFLTQEVIEEVMPGGGLHTWRRWTLPLVGALGGAVASTVVYLTYVALKYEVIFVDAWPAACAVDVVAAYAVLKMIRPRRGVLAFGVLMALAGNTIAVLAVARREPLMDINLISFALIAMALLLAALFRRNRVVSFWPYLVICGTASWLGCYLDGIHPAFALVPIVPFMPHERRTLDTLFEEKDDDATHHVEHEWSNVVQVILLAFGVLNAGVNITGYGTGTWALLTASLAGRPIGIFVGVGVAMLAGLHLPSRVGWRDLVIIALASSSGFTLALFSAVGVMATGPILAELKFGALLMSIGGVITLVVARLLHLGRFHRHRPLHG